MPSIDSAYADSSFWRRWFRFSGLVLLAIALAGHSGSAATNRAVIIQNDRGGAVIERLEIIQQYRASNTRVEIRGDYCLSSCTMFLGLPNICIAPDTVFGFHGPSSRIYGIALSAESFNHWSQIMADQYPEPLKAWFLRKGRHRIVGFLEFSGAELINMGIQQCTENIRKG